MNSPPSIEARFFYTSSLAIDDPLCPVPSPNSASTISKIPPRPFSEHDNDRLNRAWHRLQENIRQSREEHDRRQSRISVGDRSRAHGIEAVHEETGNRELESRTATSLGRSDHETARLTSSSPTSTNDSPEEYTDAIDTIIHAEAEQQSLTGKPFIRAPSRKHVPTRKETSPSRPRPQPLDSHRLDEQPSKGVDAGEERRGTEHDVEHTSRISVGVSRLHHVVMPSLDLEPIYWAPVNDVAPVVRGTWFYEDTMTPVEVPVANMLELGYHEMQAWSETWQDELNSAVEVGAAGEVRIMRKLWPEEYDSPRATVDSRPGTSKGEMTSITTGDAALQPDTPESRRERAHRDACTFLEEDRNKTGEDKRASGVVTFGRSGTTRTYATAGVIYADPRHAHILKPSLQPSTYYGRRPLANYIRKGHKLGVHVVRGYDAVAWTKLHPQDLSTQPRFVKIGVSTNEANATLHGSVRELDAAVAPKVTDLVLVVHGIGQKLSERMESFHFTHAMNGFRREINVERGRPEVRKKLRDSAGGIMVLPVNWRHTLSFEDGGYRNSDDAIDNRFQLADITPSTLPSVRNIVSDVMLDIPYYMSHHQPKMIAAVVKEANRIYKLWCSNNPDFQSAGRVHLLAHSLGSVMALDILSKQPTSLPNTLSNIATVAETDLQRIPHFAFPVTNVFFAGSPAGFFLLLKKATLRPRRGRSKPGIDVDATQSNAVCGEEGDYGCLAVDNIYNIINPYDPVSYRMNATVDAQYGRYLKTAWLPSAASGWFGKSTDPDAHVFSSWFSKGDRRPMPHTKSSLDSGTPALLRVPSNGAGSILPRLPSNVELEIHNFTREEIAEQRMYALNDNGQIDYMVRYGGGPLEIQYLTMLGAHSSYWLLKDFVRAVVLEVGREPGRDNTLEGMRCRKVGRS